ncbi:MAG: hypothetical protein HKN29_10295 [Rhodothermales bacterium]|nr:hypothetical protein [Rhodothermales bacterium]
MLARGGLLGLVLGAVVWLGQDADSTISVVPDLLSGVLMFALTYVHVSRDLGKAGRVGRTNWRITWTAMWLPALMVGLTAAAAGYTHFHNPTVFTLSTLFLMASGTMILVGYLTTLMARRRQRSAA